MDKRTIPNFNMLLVAPKSPDAGSDPTQDKEYYAVPSEVFLQYRIPATDPRAEEWKSFIEADVDMAHRATGAEQARTALCFGTYLVNLTPFCPR